MRTKLNKAEDSGDLCPNKEIKTLAELVCDRDSLDMPQIANKVCSDTVEYCAAMKGTEKDFPDNIETILLSYLYTHKVKSSQNYSWHVFVSEVHEPSATNTKAIHTNHNQIIRDPANTKDPAGFTKLANSSIHMKFYTRRECLFKVQDK